MYVPPKVMTNEDFEKLVDTSDEWIVQMTGMKERHYIEGRRGDLRHGDRRAATEALDRAGVAPRTFR